jgi:hypothetical protein
MAKKISIAEKRKWLEEYESGKPVIGIATQNQRETRTVQKALDDARRERDVRYARSELMKEALRSHQDSIRDELTRIINKLEPPGSDFTPLSWYEGDTSIFTPVEKVDILAYTAGVAKHVGRPSAANTTSVTYLLRQHLGNDRLWRLLALWDKAYASHIDARASLQRKTVLLLEQKTGYRMVDKTNIPRPFLYSYTAGAVVYGVVVGVALGTCDKSELEDDLVSDTRDGTVKYRNSIMAEDPGNEEKCRQNILDAFKDLIKSPDFERFKNSYNFLDECATKAKQSADEIKLLGYLPGNCRVCRRLGM